jgi:hypothetical protein
VSNLRVVVDYEPIFAEFYFQTGSLTSPFEGSFQEAMMSMQPMDLLSMALHGIELTITRGTLNSGIGYKDIANLSRHPEVRQAIYAGDLGPEFISLYRPTITPTEQYHLDTLQAALTDAVVEALGDASRQQMRGEDDVILWRALMATVIETAKAVSYSGHEHGLSEHALMSFSFTETEQYGREVGYNQYVYVLHLVGPG